jgi:hypothetical protein
MRQKKELQKREVQKETQEGIQKLRQEQIARKSEVAREQRQYSAEMLAKRRAQKREEEK